MSYGMASPTGTRSGQNARAFKEHVPSGYKKGALQQFTPEQMELFQSLFQHLGPESFLSQLAGGDESMFEQMEAPAMRQFAGLQGNIASRFSQGGGQGSLSSRRSSGFQNTMGSAASNFAQELQANRQGLQRQALGDLMGLSNALLNQRPVERFLAQKAPKQSSGFGGLIGGALGGLGGLATGNPMGGAALGYRMGSGF